MAYIDKITAINSSNNTSEVFDIKDTTSGYTTNTGTVTKVTVGSDLKVGNTAGGNITTTGTITHANSVTAKTTQALYPIKFDAHGHITGSGSAVTNISAFTNDAGYVTSEDIPTISYPVTSVNTKTGAVSLTASDVGAFEKLPYATGTIEAGIRPYVNKARANRLAFLPADQIIIEKTTDGGTTWTDAGYTDDQKIGLFSENGYSITIPLLNNAKSTQCGLRVTITGMRYNVPANTAETSKYNYWSSSYISSAERYFNVREWWFWLSANSDTIRPEIYCATGANPNTWTTVFNADFGMTGWSGSDWIRSGDGKRFGGSTDQTSNYWNWRIVFWSRYAEGKTSFQNTTAQSINQIRCYGDSVWVSTNNLMSKDHLYSWDNYKNATFPAKVTLGAAPTADMDAATKKYVDDHSGDTKNTAGSTDTSSKIYLIGATTQAANPQTYSHDTAYVGTDGYLYSNSKKTLVEQYSNSGYVLNITPSVSSSSADFTVQAALDNSGNFYNTLYFGSNGFYISNDIDEKTWVSIDNNGPTPVSISGVKTPQTQYDAVNKKYVDDNIPTKTSDLTNDSGFVTSDNKVKQSPIGDSTLRKGVLLSYDSYSGLSSETTNTSYVSNRFLFCPGNSSGTFPSLEVLDSSGNKSARLSYDHVILQNSSNAYETTITAGTPTANRTITLPNKTGTVALTSDIPTVPDVSGKVNITETNGDTTTEIVRDSYLNLLRLKASSSYGEGFVEISTVGTYISSNLGAVVNVNSDHISLISNVDDLSKPNLSINRSSVDLISPSITLIGLSNGKTYTLAGSATAGRTLTLPNKTGTVALTSDIPTVPTNISAFTNDAGYIKSYTDTKNTAGSTNTSSKIFLIGATSQAANPQTYSHDTAYVGTDGKLYSASKVVLVGGSNASSSVTITPSTTAVYSMTSAGSVTAGTKASFTRGTFSQGTLPAMTWAMDSTDTKKLNITFSQGTLPTHAADSFTANTPTAVTLPGRSSAINAWTGYTAATAAAQAFTGVTG